MHIEEEPKFGVTDYCVFAAMLVVSSAIGVYTHWRGNKSPGEFLMGNRSLGSVTVAMSLTTSFISAVGLLGLSGEAYAYGCQFSVTILGAIFGIMASSYVFLPVIFPLKLTSVNEYISLRFKDSRLKLVVSMSSCLYLVMYMGVCLYAPTIALVSVTDLGHMTHILLLGIICTFYSAIGGIRAVVWTDVFQMSIMVIGLVVIAVVGTFQSDGFISVLHTAEQGGRLQLFDMSPSLYVRHTFLNVVISSFLMHSQLYGIHQINVQRVCSVPSILDAEKVLRLCAFAVPFMYLLTFFLGLLSFAIYATCDPMMKGHIGSKEQIVPYFVVDKLSFIPGLPGIFVATLVGGTLSSLSSGINSIVAMIWKDVCLKFMFFRNASPKFATLVNKLLSLLTGILVIGFAVLASIAGTILEFSYVIMGVITGPIYGIFLIGFLFPKCNVKGVWTGFILSLVFLTWISVGGILYKERPEFLPMNTDGCSNVTNLLNTTSSSFLNLTDSTTHAVSEETYEFYKNYSDKGLTGDVASNNDTDVGISVVNLYKISRILYAMIGPSLCVVVALIVSCLTGNEKVEDISPKYVSPIVRKFYYSKNELRELTSMNIISKNGSCSCTDPHNL